MTHPVRQTHCPNSVRLHRSDGHPSRAPALGIGPRLDCRRQVERRVKLTILAGFLSRYRRQRIRELGKVIHSHTIIVFHHQLDGSGKISLVITHRFWVHLGDMFVLQEIKFGGTKEWDCEDLAMCRHRRCGRVSRRLLNVPPSKDRHA